MAQAPAASCRCHSAGAIVVFPCGASSTPAAAHQSAIAVRLCARADSSRVSSGVPSARSCGARKLAPRARCRIVTRDAGGGRRGVPLAGKTTVLTDAAPAPLHTFSQGVRKGPILQVSGQGAIDPATNEHVVMFRVYLTDRAHFGPMNDEYATFLAEHVTSGALPCRTTVFTGLPLELMLIEIDALAVLD